MPNRPTLAAFAALLVPGLVACVPYDRDVTEHVAVSGDAIVVTGQTVTEGGGGCGGGEPSGPPVLLVSGDAGRTFDRIVPDDPRAFRDLITIDGAFVALRTDGDTFELSRSTDGRTWTTLATHAGDAADLAVFGADLVVASSLGVHLLPRAGAEPRAWRDTAPSDAGLYAPHVVAVAGTLVVVTAAGDVFTSTDAATWRRDALPTGTSVHGATAVGDRVVVDAHAPTADGWSSAALLAFAPSAPAAVETIRIDDGAGAVIDLPIGVLVGDGSLGATLATRAPHVDAFTAAALDADEVVLVQDATLRLSRDGGVTFDAPRTLPLLDER